MSQNISILYASQDGQTQRIAQTLSDELHNMQCHNDLKNLCTGLPEAENVKNADIIVLAAAIRYGHPLPAAEAFLKTYAHEVKNKPLVLLSINLTARKLGKTTPEGSVYLRKWIKRHKLSPSLAASIAGKLDYQRYGKFDRFMIRLIMKMTGGPTDPKACVEFTDWNQVSTIAKQIAELSPAAEA